MNKKGFGVLIAVLVVLLIVVTATAGWGVWQLRQIEKEVSGADLTEELSAAPTPTNTTAATDDTTSKPAATVTPIEDPGITWTVPPEVIADQPLYSDAAIKYTGEEKIRYYKIGTTENDSDIILSLFPEMGMGASYRTFRFFKDQDSKISFIGNSSDSDRDLLEDNASVLNTDIAYNSTKLRSVTVPDFLDYKGEVLEKTSSPFSTEISDVIYQETSTWTKGDLTENGQTFIKTVEQTNNKSFNMQNVVLRLPDYTLAYYLIKPNFVTDNEVPIITWSEGTKNTTIYNKGGLGGHCGSSGFYDAIVTDATASRFTEAGTTSKGAKVYVPKDTSDILYEEAYANYIVGRDSASGADKPIAEDVFVTKKPIFLYKDGLDRYVFFDSQDFAALAECGKPVIYLYPEKTTDVLVKVGADITVSEPEYNDGWLATADPSGRLIVDGQTYNSLFWEGQGKGEYPVINSGFVVETKNIELTLKSHLTQLGLNSKESADFMTFWLPKMPTTKYTRLTWFGTHQMDKLAPLTVSPKPDTSIRIFLDYQGLDKPINLPEQKLSTIDRKGFTLVEWGGLLVK